MKVFTAHLREDSAPVLLREGFSFWAMVFGPVWLAGHRAWIPAGLVLAGEILLAVLADPPVSVTVFLAWRWLLGLTGNDLRRWALAARGYTLAHVVTARDADTALARLLAARPDLADSFLPAALR